MIGTKGVHITHCCDKHGCKYGDSECPVKAGTSKQAYPCEECGLNSSDYFESYSGGYYDDQMVWYDGSLPTEGRIANLRCKLGLCRGLLISVEQAITDGSLGTDLLQEIKDILAKTKD